MAETKVKLSCKALAEEREFDISHAQNLLNMEARMGVSNWKLTDNKFMLKDGIIQRADSKPDKGTKGEGSADKGSQA